MQHGVVTDGHPCAQGQRRAHVGVHHRTVLNIAVLADVDQFVVAAQHRAEPDTGPRLQAYFTDQRGSGRRPAAWMGFDPQVAQTVFHAWFLTVRQWWRVNPLKLE
ncbi:hypothetical protein D3C72_1796800 [compost metagenome]